MRKIEKFAIKNNIKFIDIVFLDLLGETRQITIPTERLSSCLQNGLKCDGSSINCANKIENSDTILTIDANSYYLLPNNKMMVFCFTDSIYDARKNLFDLQQKISKDKVSLNFGAEIEFFLFKKTTDITTQNIIKHFDNLKYLSACTEQYENCLTDIALFCKNKLNIETYHHECASNQFEIDFKYSTPLQTADNIVFLKRVIKHFANKHNLVACFMPKPLNNASGNGMHINISVFKSKTNLFFSKTDKNKLSKFAYDFIQNILNHINSITAITNPTVNSYKRLNGGLEAPSIVEYSFSNRNVVIRIPKATEQSTRIELRSPDVSCNPYLAFLAILTCAFKSKKTEYFAIKNLPKNLFEAIQYLKKDDLLKNVVPIGFIQQKELEYKIFENRVTDFDIEKYFNV